MRVKNVSIIPQSVTVKVGTPPTRTVLTIGPGEEFDIGDTEGINLCKSDGRFFRPADKKSDELLEESYPKAEPVNEVRKKANSTAQAEKEIARAKRGE